MSEFDKDENIFNTTGEQSDGNNAETAEQNASDNAERTPTQQDNAQQTAQNVQNEQQSAYFDYTGAMSGQNAQPAQQYVPQTDYNNAGYGANSGNNTVNNANSDMSDSQAYEQAANNADYTNKTDSTGSSNGAYFDNTAQYSQGFQQNTQYNSTQHGSNTQYNPNVQYGQQNVNSQYGQYSQNTQQYSPMGQQGYGYNTNTYPPQQSRPTKNSKKGLKIFCIILAVAVAIAGVAGIGYIAGKSDSSEVSESGVDDTTGGTVVIQQGTVPTKDGVEPDENGKYTADGVAKIVSDSVVNITVYNDASSSSSSMSNSSSSSKVIIASGIIISKDGYVLSNDHIYSEVPGAKFAVTMNNGKSYSASYVAGDSRSDLCVLKMKDANDLTPAVFADSSKLTAGEDVIAIGSPYNLSGTVTKGIVSAPSRRISFQSISGEDGSKSTHSMRVIQTDTAINSGNSGGALVNMYGQVVGVCSSKIVLSGYEGLCFAIPANDAVKYSQSLIQYKKVKGRAKLGISYKEINSASALVNDCPSGIMIQTIDVDSDLYSSGLKQGDIVTEINGTEITSSAKMLDIIDDSKAGDEVTLKVYISSSKKYKTVKAKLLEDESISSYTTKSEEATSVPFTFRFQDGQ